MPLSNISVIIPTFNDARTLPDTLRTVLAQDLPPKEILLVNDAGADPLPCLGNMTRHVRVLTQPQNRGASAARNVGLAAASGEFIHFLDSDDMVAPDFLRLAQEALLDRPQAAFAIGDGLRCPDEEITAAQLSPPRIAVPLSSMGQSTLFSHVADHPGHYLLSLTLWRRDRLEPAISGEWLDTRLTTDEDFQMYLRTALRHEAVHLQAMMGIHRLRPGSLTKNPERVWTNRTRAMDLLLTEDPALIQQPQARRRILQLRSNGARRVARLLSAEGRKTEARAVLKTDLARTQDLLSRLKTLAALGRTLA